MLTVWAPRAPHPTGPPPREELSHPVESLFEGSTPPRALAFVFDAMTDRRAEIYARIRETSKQEYILEEMIRLGFWDPDAGGPGSLNAEMKRQSELRDELRRLREAQARLRDEAALLRQIRKQRMADAKQRRAETKARREAERKARADAWAEKKAREIGYLGEGVSGALGQTQSEPDRLGAHGLPVLRDGADIARAMGIGVGALRFLAFARRTSRITHYRRFRIAKKTGGDRLISAPMPRLKAAQHWILEHIVSRVPLHDAAHGFVPGRSIVSNAAPHVGRAVVVNLDLKDFFPSIGFPRIWGQFKALGYSPAVSTILALLCTEPAIDEVTLDGRTWYVARGERFLPQGAPTSPALTNLLCRRLDRALTTLAGASGFTYTRYADDLTFSGDAADSDDVGKLLRRVRHLVEREGFSVHPDKTRVLRRGRRQEVTGLTVNHRVGVERATLRRFRATLFQIERDGPEGKTWGDPRADVLASIGGFASYVHMVDPAKGRPLLERVAAIHRAHGYGPSPAPPAPAPAASPQAAPAQAQPSDTASEGDGKPWWKLW